MEKYLLQILETNNRVIIPEFGAFIIKQKNPLTIIFNEFLQYNDGMLVDAISKSERIERDAAKKKIDDFTANINSELERNGHYTISKIGTLTKGSTGKISLEKEEPKKPGKKEAKPAEVSEKKEAPPKEEAKTTAKKAAETKEESIEIIQEKPVQERKKEEEKPPITKEEKKTEKEIPKKPEPEVKTKPVVEPTISAEEKPKDKSSEVKQPVYTSTTSYSSNKRSRTRLIVWLIIIVLINGGLVIYFFYNEEISALFNKEPVEMMKSESSPEEQLQPEIEPDEETYEDITNDYIEEEPEETIETPPATVESGSRYYVVAGVFRNENNADNLVIELKQKGYNSEKFGKIGSLHAVSYNVYYSKAEAEQELRKIQNEVDPEAWIKEIR